MHRNQLIMYNIMKYEITIQNVGIKFNTNHYKKNSNGKMILT
jgi:hypothetical protein